MHLRHKSIPGLLLNQTLVNELFRHCYQLAAILGHTFQPEFFPIMPVMMKASRNTVSNASTQSRSIPADPPQQPSGELQVSPHCQTRPAQPQATVAEAMEVSPSQKPIISVCPQCHSSFLISTGLDKHMQSHDHEAAADDHVVPRVSKVPRLDTVQAVLTRTPADIPIPPKTFICSLCHARIGRKGLAGHLRNEHQIDKAEFFSFRPSRDMMPGRLGCAHCLSCFTTEVVLKLHYQRATCPALLTE